MLPTSVVAQLLPPFLTIRDFCSYRCVCEKHNQEAQLFDSIYNRMITSSKEDFLTKYLVRQKSKLSLNKLNKTSAKVYIAVNTFIINRLLDNNKTCIDYYAFSEEEKNDLKTTLTDQQFKRFFSV
jgi:glucan phosphorylase